MKKALILTAIICTFLCNSVCAQSLFLDKGERGMLFEVGFATSAEVRGFEIGIGYASDGIVEFGIAIARVSEKSQTRSRFQPKRGRLYHTAQFVNLYPVIADLGDGEAWIIGLHESYGPLGDKILSFNNGISAGMLGGSLIYRGKTTGKTTLAYSIGYRRLFSSEEILHSNALELSFVICSKMPGTSLTFSPSVMFVKEATTLGFNICLTEIGGQ